MQSSSNTGMVYLESDMARKKLYTGIINYFTAQSHYYLENRMHLFPLG